jgi:glycine cleavage system H lipoate-binding protein
MKCPFLQEATVRFCGASAYRKMIRQEVIHQEDQCCSSPSYFEECVLARERLRERPPAAECPLLQEAQVQFCSSASITKFIPYTDALTRCACDAHRYCELYRARAHPTAPAQADEIPLPAKLGYSYNHMWFDVGDSRCVHVGVDGFLARVLGAVEEVNFLSGPDRCRPTAILTVAGVDLSLTFPSRLAVTGSNVVLRARPETLLQDPYGAGWLFEALDERDDISCGVDEEWAGLMYGEAARQWMRSENERMSQWVHSLHSRRQIQEESLAADGGGFTSGLAQSLNREELLGLWDQFFGPK